MSTALLLLSLLPSTPAMPTAPDTTLRLTRGAMVEINSFMTSIAVHVGSDDMLRVRNGSIDGGPGGVEVLGDSPRQPGRGTLDVTVPAWARLEIDSHSGTITVEGAIGRLDASSLNGGITLRGGTGTANLETINGSVTVSDFHGDKLSIDATSGGVTVTGSSGIMEIESVNGAIRMRDMRATEVHAGTVNEAVEYSGTMDPKGRYEFESHNGGILLALPTDVSARIKVTMFNGEFTTDLPGTTTGNRPTGDRRGMPMEREFTVGYGAGGATVTVDTFNGDVQVRRYRAR